MVIKIPHSKLTENWKYSVSVKNIDWCAAQDWCDQFIGVFDHDWYKLGIDPAEFITTGELTTTWWFKNEKDAMLFKLKWS